MSPKNRTVSSDKKGLTLQYEKQEKIYLNAYETGAELYAGVKECIEFYNTKHPHQSLDYQTPENVYKKDYQQIA